MSPHPPFSNIQTKPAMVFDSPANSFRLSGHRFSTVVSRHVTGDDVVRELTDMDLVMKLHYLRVVYYFRNGDAAEGLGIMELKAPMFPWLDVYYPVTGRIRRGEGEGEGGRPYIKCNDAGVRIIEARCGYEMDEWMEMEDHGRHWQLVSDKTLGPDLSFSPALFIQFTRFQCGGLAVGFSWAHLLGDPISAANCINLWGHLLAGSHPPPVSHLRANTLSTPTSAKPPRPITSPAFKTIQPVGDDWKAPTVPTMSTLSIQIQQTKLDQLQTKTSSCYVSPFESLSALIWHYISRIRDELYPKSVTIIRPISNESRNKFELTNEMIIASVTSECSPAKMELSELAMLIRKQEVDEKEEIGEVGDVVVYGARLTFVDMEAVELDGLELKGQKAVEVEYGIGGVGDEGTVLVRRVVGGDGGGRVVTLMLVEEEMRQLRDMLRELGIA